MLKLFKDGVIPGLIAGFWMLAYSNSLFMGLLLATILAAAAIGPTWKSAKQFEKKLAVGFNPEKQAVATRLLSGLCQTLGMPIPKVIVYNPKKTGQIFAAAVGANEQAIVCSVPLLDLNLDQVKGVLLHELGHIYYSHLLKRRILSVFTLYAAIIAMWIIGLYTSAALLLFVGPILFSLRVIVRTYYAHLTEKQADLFSHRVLAGGLKGFLARNCSMERRSWFSSHPSNLSRLKYMS